MTSRDAEDTSLEALSLQHGAFLRRLARQLVGEGSADDLVQETWVVAVKRGSPALRAPRAWLAATARRLALRHHRREGLRRTAELEDDALASAPDETARAAETLEVERNLLGALDRVTEPYRTTLFLRYREERSLDDIARRLRVPVNTVRSRLRRGLDQLRTELARGRPPSTLGAMLLPLLRPEAKAGQFPTFAASVGALLTMKKALTAAALGSALLLALLAASYLINAGRAGQPSQALAGRADDARDLSRVAAPTDPAPPKAVEGVKRGRLVPVPWARPEGVTLRVTAVDAMGVPLSGHPIRCLCETVVTSFAPPASARTDASGRATFHGLPYGLFRVESACGLGSMEVECTETDERDVVLECSGESVTVAGVTVTPDGTPIPGAEISAVCSKGTGLRLPALTRSNDAGEFVINVGLGQSLVASAAGSDLSTYLFADENIADRKAVLVLYPADLTVHGQVVDESGRPVFGALIKVTHIKPASYGTMERVSSTTTSDKDGLFEFPNSLPRVEAEIDVLCRGFAPLRMRASVNDVNNALLLRLSRGRSILIKVVDPSGGELEGAEVTLEQGEHRVLEAVLRGAWAPCVRTDHAGLARVRGVPLGPVTVVARSYDDDWTLRRGFAVVSAQPGTASDRGRIQVVATERPFGTGRVVDEDGHPASGMLVQARARGGDRWHTHVHTARTDAAGAFKLTSLWPPDEWPEGALWEFVAYDHSNAKLPLGSSGPVALDADDLAITIMRAPDRTAQLSGAAAVRGHGAAPDGIEVWLSGPGGEARRLEIAPGSGAFEAVELQAGTYELNAWFGDVRFLQGGIELDAGESVDVGTLEIGCGGSLAVAPRLESTVDVPADALDGLYRNQVLRLVGPGGERAAARWREGAWRSGELLRPGTWRVEHSSGERLAIDAPASTVRDSAVTEIEGRVRLAHTLWITLELPDDGLAGEDAWSSIELTIEEVVEGPGRWSEVHPRLVRGGFDGEKLSLRAPVLSRCIVRASTDSGWTGEVHVDVPQIDRRPSRVSLRLAPPR